MGSFAIGFLSGAEYGLMIGLISFFVIATAGIILHYMADKIRKHDTYIETKDKDKIGT